MGHIRTAHSRNYPRGVFHLALCGEDGDDHHDDEEFDYCKSAMLYSTSLLHWGLLCYSFLFYAYLTFY